MGIRIICDGCGYRHRGLPPDGWRCPMCGSSMRYEPSMRTTEEGKKAIGWEEEEE